MLTAMSDTHAMSLSGRTAWARNLAAPVRDFLSTETGSALVLLGAIVAALVWANSPWPDSYESFWGTELAFRLGHWTLAADLRHWVNDGLMTLFFLVVGDLAGLLVIATVYTDHVSFSALAVAGGLFVVLLALRFAPVGRSAAATVVGVGMWVALFKSGVHPTIAGLAFGLVTAAYPPSRDDLERVTEVVRSFREQPTPELARSAQQTLVSAISENARLQIRLHPWTSYAIVPVFALANAGIHIDANLLGDAIGSPITLGIALGYAVGKPAGIMVATWIAVHTGKHRPRLPITFAALRSAGAVAGIGFTVSLLIASLAFTGEQLQEAKIGILATLVLATLEGWLAVTMYKRIPDSARARQLLRTAQDIPDLIDDVDPERDHVRGPSDAPVTLLEYGDYECPYCGQAEAVIRELLADFGDDLRYVWRQLPLNDVHQHAQMAAEAAEAAGAQGAFWEMHDLLLAHQDELRPADLHRYALQLGLDVERFWDDIRRHEHLGRIEDDVGSADAGGVAGTPSFFINGRRYEGAYDVATLTSVVSAARRRARLL